MAPAPLPSCLRSRFCSRSLAISRVLSFTTSHSLALAFPPFARSEFDGEDQRSDERGKGSGWSDRGPGTMLGADCSGQYWPLLVSHCLHVPTRTQLKCLRVQVPAGQELSQWSRRRGAAPSLPPCFPFPTCFPFPPLPDHSFLSLSPSPPSLCSLLCFLLSVPSLPSFLAHPPFTFPPSLAG